MKRNKTFLLAAVTLSVLALTACSGYGGDAETSQAATTATKTTGESTTEAVTTKKQAVKDTSKSKETTVPEERKTEQGTTKSGGNAEDTTVWEPVTEEQGGGYEPGTTAHQHSWVWVEPVTHVETIYETVYHPPVTYQWTHNVVDGEQYRCLRCWSVFLDARECVEHCIICGGSMRTEDHYTEVIETEIVQEEYWSEEAVGTKTVIDSEGYWKCSECGSLK